jgi:hypothetical protein
MYAVQITNHIVINVLVFEEEYAKTKLAACSDLSDGGHHSRVADDKCLRDSWEERPAGDGESKDKSAACQDFILRPRLSPFLLLINPLSKWPFR